MQINESVNSSIQEFHVDWYTMFKDILKEWRCILMIAIAAVFLSYSWQYVKYTETYTVNTTFTVSTKGTYTDIYSNLASASDTATEFSQLLNSSILQKKVAEELGMGYMPGTVKAEVITDTNLMTLTVTESSPKLAYEVMEAVLNNYDKVSATLLGNVALDILVQPQIPEHPDASFAPEKMMVKAFGGALVIMIVFIALISFFKDTIRKEREVEKKLDTKLLGTLFHENKYKTLSSKLHKPKTSILITNPTVSFRYSESVKKLASRVRSKMEHRKAKVVLVTSVSENEGKSTVAANLAIALSEESKRVLLLDGDFRKPALYKIFGFDSDEIYDFGEVLNGKQDAGNLIYKLPDTDLRMMLNTVAYPDSTEMLAQGLLKRVIDYLKQNLDYIIIDSSPMALVADTEEMLDMADAAILVVKQHMSSVRDINDAIDVLNRREMKLLGCVFNDVGGEQFSMGHGYGGYSGYGGYGNYSGSYGKYGYGSRYQSGTEKRSKEESKA